MAPQTAPARQNLPSESSTFVGRDRDLSDLLRLLGASRVVTLCGVSGIGKTRLALRVAEQATGSFPDGVWFAELTEATTRREVLTRIAHAVGVAEESTRDLAATVIDSLRRRRLLLVLDGCDGVSGELVPIARMLLDACPSVSLLLSSADPMRVDGEVIWRVPPLSLPQDTSQPPADTAGGSEAVRLFVERSHGSGVSPGQLATIADVCRRLDGIALCIELVAAVARHRPTEAIADLLAGHLPAAEHERDTDRHKILDSVLELSYSLLGETEQLLLRRLSTFATWDLELAERVCADQELPEADILDAASTLVDRSLVVLTGEHQGRVRYRLPRAVHRFAAARLAESGEADTAHTRHRDHMLRLSEELGRVAVLGRAMPWVERHDVWLRVEAEHDNVRRALHWSADRRDTEQGLRICAGLHPFWVSGRQIGEATAWSELFLGMPGGTQAMRARVMGRRADRAWLRNDFTLARQSGEEALRLCHSAGEFEPIHLALHTLALADMRDGADERATERVTESVRRAREHGDLWNESLALCLLGALATRRGDFGDADRNYNTALLILRGMDHRWGVGIALIGHAISAETQHDLDTADRCYREALDIHRDIAVFPELARCLAGVGRIAHAQGAVAQGYDYLSEGLLLSQSTGQRAGVARALDSVAQLATSDGFAEGAVRLSGAAAGVRHSLGLSDGSAPRAPRAQVPDSTEELTWWEQGYALDLDEAVAMALRIAEAARVPRPRPPQSPAPDPPKDILTRREREIALHIGKGGSNRDIATTLFITQTTVARHVANINRKTGFTSRKQIASWINEERGRRSEHRE